jgi:transposase
VVLAPAPAVNSQGDDDAGGTIVLEIGQVCIRIEVRADASVLVQVLERMLRCIGLPAVMRVWLGAGIIDS